MYLEQIMVGPMAVFAYFIGCRETGRAALIDPAGSEEGLVDRVRTKGFELEAIINTHGHADHIGGNARVKELTGAPIIIGRPDNDYLTPAYSERCQTFGLTPSPPADRVVDQGEVIRIGKIDLEVRMTPGHTRGGMCLVAGSNVFTGDTLFVGSIGRTDLPGGSFDRLMGSIASQLLSLPGTTVVWPGHAYSPLSKSTISRERETNPYLREYIRTIP